MGLVFLSEGVIIGGTNPPRDETVTVTSVTEAVTSAFQGQRRSGGVCSPMPKRMSRTIYDDGVIEKLPIRWE
ncbi:hypothetical protein J6590_092178 [Homalodisca vitripennis]|nr:hypothetical protein J6590_092178 [Homalodisca vitripennis]